jgi:hypothetical protein
MSLGIWEFNAIQGVNGDVVIVNNPQVEVRRESDGQLATIYEDVQGTTPLLNPFTAEANGTVRFYADETDLYQVKISKPPVAQTLRHQGVSITADLDALQGLVNVKAFGAVGDGETDDTDAFDAAAEALTDDFGTIIVPAGEYVVSSLSSNAKPVWFLLGARDPSEAPLNLPGLQFGAVARDRLEIRKEHSAGDDFALGFVVRKANHTGGASNFVNSALRVETEVGPNVTNIEWALLGIVHNESSAGENVGVYGQGNRKGTGPTWGMVAEARDHTGNADPTTGLVGVEVDVFANGSDAHNNRIGIDIVAGKGLSGGAIGIVGAGIRLGPQHGDDANGAFKSGILFDGDYETGINLRAATSNQGGAMIALAEGHKIAFEGTNNRNLYYSMNRLRYEVNGTDVFHIGNNGAVHLNSLRTVLDGTFGSGSSAPRLTANKPGRNAGVGTWLKLIIDGQTFWIPCFEN